MKHSLLPNAAHEASIVSLKHRYVLVINSKTAGSTLKAVAAVLESEHLATRNPAGMDERAQRMENWLRTPTLADLPASKLREVLLGDQFFRFSSVRDPGPRTWSAFIDKLVGHHPEFIDNFGTAHWFPHRVTADDLLDQFVAFLGALNAEPGLLGADRHWAPQVDVLRFGVFPYDYIGKTESLGELVERWQERTELPVTEAVASVGRRNSRSLPFPSWAFDAIRPRLSRLFERDYRSFDYNPDATPTGAASESEWHSSVQMFLAELEADPTRGFRSRRSSAWQWARASSARTCRRLAARAPGPK